MMFSLRSIAVVLGGLVALQSVLLRLLAVGTTRGLDQHQQQQQQQQQQKHHVQAPPWWCHSNRHWKSSEAPGKSAETVLVMPGGAPAADAFLKSAVMSTSVPFDVVFLSAAASGAAASRDPGGDAEPALLAGGPFWLPAVTASRATVDRRRRAEDSSPPLLALVLDWLLVDELATAVEPPTPTTAAASEWSCALVMAPDLFVLDDLRPLLVDECRRLVADPAAIVAAVPARRHQYVSAVQLLDVAGAGRWWRGLGASDRAALTSTPGGNAAAGASSSSSSGGGGGGGDFVAQLAALQPGLVIALPCDWAAATDREAPVCMAASVVATGDVRGGGGPLPPTVSGHLLREAMAATSWDLVRRRAWGRWLDQCRGRRLASSVEQFAAVSHDASFSYGYVLLDNDVNSANGGAPAHQVITELTVPLSAFRFPWFRDGDDRLRNERRWLDIKGLSAFEWNRRSIWPRAWATSDDIADTKRTCSRLPGESDDDDRRRKTFHWCAFTVDLQQGEGKTSSSTAAAAAVLPFDEGTGVWPLAGVLRFGAVPSRTMALVRSWTCCGDGGGGGDDGQALWQQQQRRRLLVFGQFGPAETHRCRDRLAFQFYLLQNNNEPSSSNNELVYTDVVEYQEADVPPAQRDFFFFVSMGPGDRLDAVQFYEHWDTECAPKHAHRSEVTRFIYEVFEA